MACYLPIIDWGGGGGAHYLQPLNPSNACINKVPEFPFDVPYVCRFLSPIPSLNMGSSASSLDPKR